MAKKIKQNSEADLGLGDRVIQENRTRFVNRDGSFNVHKKGIFDHGTFSPYHAILNASWWRFNWGVILYYFIANIVFTILYALSGRKAFPEIASLDALHRVGQLFFYSVQVITTLGTSPLHPNNLAADVVLAIEAMVGMLGFAVGASLMFARFSNPPTKIIFSNSAVIAPYHEITGFMIRIINGRSNELVDVGATLTLAMDDENGKRQLQTLSLEREKVLVLPLNWTIVHPVDESSPIYGMTLADLLNRHAEFMLGLKGVDQDLSKTVYSRTSYLANEIKFGMKFKSIIERDQSGTVVVDPKRISETEKVD